MRHIGQARQVFELTTFRYVEAFDAEIVPAGDDRRPVQGDRPVLAAHADTKRSETITTNQPEVLSGLVNRLARNGAVIVRSSPASLPSWLYPSTLARVTL